MLTVIGSIILGALYIAIILMLRVWQTEDEKKAMEESYRECLEDKYRDDK